MDRISALRNVEDALAAFERGEADLSSTERRVVAVIRTYATEFEASDDEAGTLAAYRAVGEERVDGLVVVAATPEDARERVVELAAEAASDGDGRRAADGAGRDGPSFEVERVD